MGEKTIEERAQALAMNPELHDPDALKYLMKGFAQKTLDLVREVAMRDAVIGTCRRLAESHAGQCGITDAIGMMLSQKLGSSMHVNVTAIAMTDQGFTMPDGEGCQIATREDDKGHYARAVSTKDARILAEVGPYASKGEAIHHAHVKVLEALGFEDAVPVGPGSASMAPGPTDIVEAVRAAMAGQRGPGGTVH